MKNSNNIPNDQIWFVDTYGEDIPFVDTADSRETSVELMQAIYHTADGDEKVAERIWEDPTDAEMLAIFETVTSNGLRDAEDYFWGENGNLWWQEHEEKVEATDMVDMILKAKAEAGPDAFLWLHTSGDCILWPDAESSENDAGANALDRWDVNEKAYRLLVDSGEVNELC